MLKLGVPSKGRLMERPLTGLARVASLCAKRGPNANMQVLWTGSRGWNWSCCQRGRSRANWRWAISIWGVTGSDLVREKLVNWDRRVREMALMGFGGADLVIAVPQAWVDVDTLDDLDAAAAAFRARHGFRLRIATKYHRLVREFLRDNGVADYQLIDSQGATEGTVKNETAEAIADITSTGETLRANGLKILSDGLIHASQATLFRGSRANWTTEQRKILKSLERVLQL